MKISRTIDQPHAEGVTRVRWSPVGRVLATASHDKTVKIWDTESGFLVHVLADHQKGVVDLSFTPNGRTLVSTDFSNVRIWDVHSGALIRAIEAHRGWVLAVAVYPNGHLVASSGLGRFLKIWNVTTGENVFAAKQRGTVESIAVSGDAKILALSIGAMIYSWDAHALEEVHQLRGHRRAVKSIAFSPDGSTLVSGADDGCVKLWDARSGHELATMKGYRRWVHCDAYSQRGDIVASGGGDGTIRLWDCKSYSQIAEESAHIYTGGAGGPLMDVSSVSFSPDGTKLASGGSDGNIIIWELQDKPPAAPTPSGRPLRELSAIERPFAKSLSKSMREVLERCFDNDLYAMRDVVDECLRSGHVPEAHVEELGWRTGEWWATVYEHLKDLPPRPADDESAEA